MDKQLEIALAKLLEKASSGIDSASVFLQAQIPDVVHQFLMWRLWESAINNFLAILLSFFAYKLICEMKRPSKDTNSLFGRMDGDMDFLFTFVIFVCLCFSSYRMINNDFIQILVAPKIYLIEQAAKIINP